MSEKILSVDRALDILILLYNNNREMGISEIARELDLHKSTVHRSIATLEDKGFVEQNEENQKYWLGIKIYAMGLLIGEKLSLADMIKPYAKELFEIYKEVVNVSILDKGVKDLEYNSVVIAKESDGNRVLSVNPNVGSSTPAYASSVGKCLLAFSKDVNIENFRGHKFERFTEHTICDGDKLVEELLSVRKKGYAVDNEEQELGLLCIGAPILDKNGDALAAISISGPSIRMKRGDLEEKISTLKEMAQNITMTVRQLK